MKYIQYSNDVDGIPEPVHTRIYFHIRIHDHRGNSILQRKPTICC